MVATISGILMALLLVEMVAATRTSLSELVEALLKEAGPSHYARNDLRLSHPVSKSKMVERLVHEAPASVGGVKLSSVNSLDGVKYLFDDDSWLLIRPSGTEPVLRVYAEAREPQMVEALLAHGRTIADLRA